MKKTKLQGSSNLSSKIILGLFVFILLLAFVAKNFLGNEPAKESSLPVERINLEKLQLIGVTRSPEYLHMWFRDPLWSERDFSKVKVYPYKKDHEMGEAHLARRELRIYRIEAKKGYYSAKVDYDGELFYFNEVDFKTILEEEPTREAMILDYLRYMKEVHESTISFYKEEKSKFAYESDRLQKKIIEMQSDQLFLTEEQKKKLDKDIESYQANINKYNAFLEEADGFIAKENEQIRLLEEEKEFINSGKVAPLEAPPKEEESSVADYEANRPKTFRFVFSHLDDEGNGVFEKYYHLDTTSSHETAKFYKTDLHGKFYVDFHKIQSDYLFLKNIKTFSEDVVDETLRVIFIKDEGGLYEVSNLDMMKKTNLEITCLDASGEPLKNHEGNFSVNKNMDDFLSFKTNDSGVMKIQNVDISSNGLYYLQLHGATNTVELKANPASLLLQEATFTFPPPPKKEEPVKTPEPEKDKPVETPEESGS